jgi:hypothetical protein
MPAAARASVSGYQKVATWAGHGFVRGQLACHEPTDMLRMDARGHSVREPGVGRLRTDVDYRKYKGIGHGFGLGTGTAAEGWIEDAVCFWTKEIKPEIRVKGR